jgi:hypothetical protein
MPDGSLVFGSRWEGGLLKRKPGDANGYRWEKVKSGEIPLNSIADVLSNIYAFNCFINNIDRTSENFIVREKRIGYAFLAFDFSRAWIRFGVHLPGMPLEAGCHTVGTQRDPTIYCGTAYINPDSTNRILERIAKICFTARALSARADLHHISGKCPLPHPLPQSGGGPGWGRFDRSRFP